MNHPALTLLSGPSGGEPDVADGVELLTVPEMAALLRLNAKTLYRLVEQAKIPGVRRIGTRAIRFYRPEVIEWLTTGERRDPRTRRKP